MIQFLRKHPMIYTSVLALTIFLAWIYGPYPVGAAVALYHKVIGRQEVVAYGMLNQGFFEYAECLKERYGITIRIISGCCVSLTGQRYAQGYNDIAYPLLKRSFGRDIFAECAEGTISSRQ